MSGNTPEAELEAEALEELASAHLAAGRYREALECLNSAHRGLADMYARGELPDLDFHLDRIEDDYLDVAEAWAESIESKDRFTEGHCQRVARYSCLVGKAVGISGRALTWLRIGAYLHDVGKVTVPAEVLNRAGSLTADEWVQMQTHTVAGDEIVEALNLPWDIRPIVRSHHERWDGYGYPDELSGGAIPLTARIVSLADVFDALTTTRSFREAYTREEALRMMDSEVGRSFDPELFVLFRSLVLGRSPGVELHHPLVMRKVSAA